MNDCASKAWAEHRSPDEPTHDGPPSVRKPHRGNAGYVCERKSKHPKLPGHFVIYDRDASPSPGIDADHRWIVMHEPSSAHVAVASLRSARELMKAMADGSNDADFGQHGPDGATAGDDDEGARPMMPRGLYLALVDSDGAEVIRRRIDPIACRGTMACRLGIDVAAFSGSSNRDMYERIGARFAEAFGIPTMTDGDEEVSNG